MDTDRFDALTLAVSTLLSRRTLVGGLAVSALGLPSLIDAKKKKKKKVTFNDFGCVNVGKFCKNSGQCCSGICKGKKGKKRCQGHDASTCQPGQTASVCGGTDVACTTSRGDTGGTCFTTTGNAGYCSSSGTCALCQKDADCELVQGSGAACVPCAAECEVGTACVGLQDDV